jgi:hypothetical protein
VPLLFVVGAGSCGGDEAPAEEEDVAADGGDGHEHAHDDTTSVTFGADDADTTLTVTLRDYGFVGIPSRVSGPNVRFVATIRGSNRHEIDVLAADGESVAVLPPFATGDGDRTLDAVLPPGTYSVQCRVKEGTRTHAQLGMRQDLVVD